MPYIACILVTIGFFSLMALFAWALQRVTLISENNQPTHTSMPDIAYILTTVGFFALMIVFIWACEKV